MGLHHPTIRLGDCMAASGVHNREKKNFLTKASKLLKEYERTTNRLSEINSFIILACRLVQQDACIDT